MSAAVPALLLLDLGDVLARYDPAPSKRVTSPQRDARSLSSRC